MARVTSSQAFKFLREFLGHRQGTDTWGNLQTVADVEYFIYKIALLEREKGDANIAKRYEKKREEIHRFLVENGYYARRD